MAADKTYPTDLTDDQWTLVEFLLPPAKRGGRPRTVDLRVVLNTIFYLNKAGCQWRMLPTDLSPRSTAYDDFAAWKADGTWQAVNDVLRRQVRVKAGRDPEPSKAAIDSQTTKASEAGGPRGYDGGKEITGRKRHVVVDTLGLLLAVPVTAANLDDGTAAPGVLARLTGATLGRLGEVRGDSKYNNRALDKYLAESEAPYKVPVQGARGEPPARGEGPGPAAVPVGGRADARLVRQVPAERPRLRADDDVGPGHADGVVDPPDAPAAGPGPDGAAGPVQVPANADGEGGVTFRTDSNL